MTRITDPVNGLDKLIPSEVLRSARGFAILTLVKAGFVFSARAGTGVVIARLPNGSWSAPSAIGTGGLGFGGQAGAELTEFIIVLNSKSAVRSFMSAGSVTLGGNLSVAVGPLGRNAEGTGSLNTKGKVAAMYSYSRTKGLFGGVSIEGSIIVERQDANAKAYGQDVTAKQLLSGAVDPPPFADVLINCIKQRAGNEVDPNWIDDAPSPEHGRNRGYSFGSPHAARGSNTPTQSSRYNEFDEAFSRSDRYEEQDPFAENPRSSPTWRPRDRSQSRERDGDEDGYRPRASIDTINDERDEEQERIWQPRDAAPAPSPKLKKPLFRSNRSRSSSSASVTRSNFQYNPTIDGDAAGRATPPPPTKARMSPFNRSRSSSSASKLNSDFVVPPAVHSGRASPVREASPVSSPRFPTSFSTSATSRHKSKGSLDVANDSSVRHHDDYIALGSGADSLRAASRGGPHDLLSDDFDDDTGRMTDDFGRLNASTSSSNGASGGNRHRSGSFQFAGNTTRLATAQLGVPKPAFLTTDTRKVSFGSGEGQAIALYDFNGTEDGDLSFKRNDVITVVKRIDGEEWWTGRIGMREGIFPLNRVELIDVPKR